MAPVLFVALALLVSAAAAYAPGERIDVFYQIRNLDYETQWEPVPFPHRPEFGRSSVITMNDLHSLFFENDVLKMFAFIPPQSRRLAGRNDAG